MSILEPDRGNETAEARRSIAAPLYGLGVLESLIETSPKDVDAATAKVLSFLGRRVSLLGSPLMPGEEIELGALPIRLITLCGPANNILYAVVDDKGCLTVGRCDEIERREKRYLHDFDRRQDVILSLVHTRAPWRAERVTDLFVTVQRYRGRPPELVVYHAVILLDRTGNPLLEPARDDSLVGPDRNLWAPLSAEGFPKQVTSVNATCAIDDDLLAKSADEHYPLHDEGAALVAWTRGASAWGNGDERLTVAIGQERLKFIAPHGERIRSLAVDNGSLLADGAKAPERGVIRFVAACGGRHVIGFEVDPQDLKAELKPAWIQPIDRHPRLVAMLPQHFGALQQMNWPDVLVAFPGGRVVRYHYIGSRALDERWGKAWSAIERWHGLQGFDNALEWVQRTLQPQREPSDVMAETRRRLREAGARQAVLRHMVECLLNASESAGQETRKPWIHNVSELFRNDETGLVAWPALDFLLDELTTWANNQTSDRGGEPLVLQLVAAIYENRPPFSIQDRIDPTIRKIAAMLPADKWTPAFAKLASRSKDNRSDLLERSRPEDQEWQLRHAALLLERWADFVELSDSTRRLAKDDLGEAVVVCLSKGDRRYVIVANHNALRCVEIGANGKLLDEQIQTFPISPRLVRASVLVVGGEERLLVGCRGGVIRSFSLDAAQTLCPSDGDEELAVDGEILAMATVEMPNGDGLVALGVSKDRQSKVLLYRWSANQRPCEVWSKRVEHAVPRSIDVAWGESGGVYVLLGGGGDAHAALYKLKADGEGFAFDNGIRRTVDSRVVVVRFDDPKAPHYAILGERSGTLWCIDLDEKNPSLRLRWIYQMDGTVRSINITTVGQHTYAVAGVEGGKLVVLRVLDGVRVWKHALPAALQSSALVRTAVAPLLVTLMAGGYMALFAVLSKEAREQALSEVPALLHAPHIARWAQSSSPGWRADHQMLWAVYQITHRGAHLSTIFGQVTLRGARAKVLRYLLYRGVRPAIDDVAPLCEALTYRDITLLLMYLMEGVPGADPEAWDAVISHVLSREPRDKIGDDSPNAGMSAEVARIHLLSRRGATLQQLIAHKPPERVFHYRWVKLEFSRLVLQAVVRAAETDDEAKIQPQLLDVLSELSPEMVDAMATAAGEHSPYCRLLRALANIMDVMNGRVAPADQDVRTVFDICHQAADHELSKILAAIAQIALRGSPTQQQWDGEDRARWLEALRALSASMRDSSRQSRFVEDVRSSFARYLPKKPMPHDQAELKTRQLWLADAIGKLGKMGTQHRVDGPQPQAKPLQDWRLLMSQVVALTIQHVRTILDLETRYCSGLARPFVRAKIEPGEAGAVTLHAAFVAETSRPLRHVTVLVNAAQGEGLLPIQGYTRQGKLSAGVVQPDQTIGEVIFQGGLRAHQTHVAMVVELVEESCQHVERWSIPVPKRVDTSHIEGPLKELPATMAALRRRIVHADAGVTVVVVDTEVGRRMITEETRALPGVRVIPLDERLLAKVGKRERRDLSISALLERREQREGLAPAIVSLLDVSGDESEEISTVIVTSMDETLGALFTEAGAQALDGLLAYFQRHDATKRFHLVLLVSSEHGTLLRARSPGFSFVPVHHMARLDPSLRSEHLRWVDTFAPNHASRTFRELGDDLRLAVLLERKAREAARGHLDVLDFLRTSERVEKLVMSDLQSLSPMDLLHVTLGGVMESQIPLRSLLPGMVPAQDVYKQAPPRRSEPEMSARSRGDRRSDARELIQRAFVPLTDESIKNLRSNWSDPSAPRSLWVQGFAGASRARGPAQKLAAIFDALYTIEQRTKSLLTLCELGFGEVKGMLFRTTSTYGVVLRKRYEEDEKRRAALPGTHETVDEMVFKSVAGQDSVFSEGARLKDVAALSEDVLQLLFPRLSSTGLHHLRALAGIWQDGQDIEPKVLSFLEGIFQGSSPKGITEGDDMATIASSKPCVVVYGLGPVGRAGQQDEYLVWLAEDARLQLPLLHQALKALHKKVLEAEAGAGNSAPLAPVSSRRGGAIAPASGAGQLTHVTSFTPLIMITGPGAAHASNDTSRKCAVLREQDILWAAAQDDLGRAFRRRARTRTLLTAFSPFRSSGALPPGSPLFVGRDAEIELIKRSVQGQKSVMIVGGRKIGKTSLLNQMYRWADQQALLKPYFVDCQGVLTGKDLVDRLLGERRDATLAPGDTLERLVDDTLRQGLRPVFFFNEVDNLLYNEPAIFNRFRGFHDKGARFVMVGYAEVIFSLRELQSAFFNFCEGTHYDKKAIALANLDVEPARQLMDLLEGRDLALRWKSKEDQQKGYDTLLDESYRIPWLLQRLCHMLVERMEQEDRDTIQHRDVEQVVRKADHPMWQYIQGIDFSRIGLPRQGERQGDGRQDASEQIRGPAIFLLLLSIVRQRYFLYPDDPCARRPVDLLHEKRGLIGVDTGFTITEARDIALATINDLLVGGERTAAREWFDSVDMHRIFWELTLTHLIEPDPNDAERFSFLLHILPRELHRQYGDEDVTLDRVFVDKAAEFWRILNRLQGNEKKRA